MKKIICVKCNCEINPSAGFYNYPSGVQCTECGREFSKKLAKALQEDPFGLKAAVKLNRIRNNPKKK